MVTGGSLCLTMFTCHTGKPLLSFFSLSRPLFSKLLYSSRWLSPPALLQGPLDTLAGPRETACHLSPCTKLNAIFLHWPKAMTAASRYLQSACRMLSLMKGRTWGTTSSSQHVAISIRHTPAALHGFHSSSSSNSSWETIYLWMLILFGAQQVNNNTAQCTFEFSFFWSWASKK